MKVFFIVVSLLISLKISAQQAKITSNADRTEIKIGEQINYEIIVETDSLKVVSFPSGEHFLPIEVVDSQKIDTFRQQEKFRLIKTYFLTQFDSGNYLLPKQLIQVGNDRFYTDSLLISVKDVPVDTLKTPLFPIKIAINVEKNAKSLVFVVFLWILSVLALVFLSFLVYFYFFRKKKLSEEEKIALLPPFDRAILGLKRLQNSRYLIESKHKEYYSELTDIVRKYLEEEVNISATESTTDELLQKIQTYLDAGRLNLSEETLLDLKNVLQKADLVKFAKSQPLDSEAETDRDIIEKIVVKTKEALPEPTEEEKMKDEYYKQQLEIHRKKQKKKRKIIIGISLVALSLLAGSGYYWYKSLKEKFVIDTNDWVTSVYGYPSVLISTPEALKREKNIEDNSQSFSVKNPEKELFVKLSITKFEDNSQEGTATEERILNLLEAQIKQQFEGQNIITKFESYQTQQGLVGNKVFGTFTTKVKENQQVKLDYQFYVFVQEGRLTTLLFAYPEENMWENILVVEKIMSSLTMK